MRVLRFWAFGAALCAGVGCGSRTGLLVYDETPPDAESRDVTADATVAPEGAADATVDVFDGGMDAPIDASVDTSLDTREEAVADALQDVRDVTIDAPHPRPIGCEDAGATFIYVTTQQGDLWSFYPPTIGFKRVGAMVCPTILPAATPFSMAVDHGGTAYVVYSDGELFRVSTATARCQSTNFLRDQAGFHTFGMGFSQNPNGRGETLFVASDPQPGDLPPRLGVIDTTSLFLRTVAFFQPPLPSAELSGTGTGDLYAFYALSGVDAGGDPLPPPSAIGRVDKNTGRVSGETLLGRVGQGCAWAFAVWGGDFYLFTASPLPGSKCLDTTPVATAVTRFRPTDGSVQEIAKFEGEIVGAGVSTCAPGQ